jgi:hypothetical protein
MHFDGKVFIPEEPVDLPMNEPLDFEYLPPEPEWDPERAKAAIRRIVARAKPVGIPLEALRRENMYEDCGA